MIGLQANLEGVDLKILKEAKSKSFEINYEKNCLYLSCNN